MIIIGVDNHPSDQYITFVDRETGEYGERQLSHSEGEAEKFYRELTARRVSVRVGMGATGYSRWFEWLLAELGIEVWSEQHRSPKTHELHSGNCKTLKRFFRGEWLDEISQGMVEDFKLRRIGEKRWGEIKGSAVSGVTVNRALSTLRLIYNYADPGGFQVSNPVKHVTFFIEAGRTRIISPKEEQAYLAAASQHLRDIARIMLETGTRPEEVFRIVMASLDFVHRTVFNPLARQRLPGTS